MTEALRGPTEDEHRAVQAAVDAGDMKQAEKLLNGIRRRLERSNKNRTAKPAAPGKSRRTKLLKAVAKMVKKNEGVRVVRGFRFKVCATCCREYSVNRDGRLRAHKDLARGATCTGSGALVAKAWKMTGKTSIRVVSGGLPGLGKRN